MDPKRTVAMKDIDTRIFTRNWAIGSATRGNIYSLVGWLKSPIKSIQFYYNAQEFGRIIMEKHDGTNITIGTKTDSMRNDDPWLFDRNERFTDVKLYSNGQTLTGIKLSSRIGQQPAIEHSVGLINYKFTDPPVDIPVGSGMCVGIFGNHDNVVNALGLALLKDEPQ